MYHTVESSVLLLVLIIASYCADTDTTTEKQEIREFSLEVTHLASSVSSIELTWKVLSPENISVEKYQVLTVKNGSAAITTGPDIPNTQTEYVVDDLVADSIYHVCVVASLVNNSVPVEYKQCLVAFTIPYILENSLYVLCGTIGVIVFLVLVGFITWRCAMCHAESSEGKQSKSDGKADAEKGEDAPFLASSSTKPELEIRKVFRPNPVEI